MDKLPHNQPHNQQDNQQGFVSIITTSLIMIILTLVVIGFSQLMQREQRQSIDRQLNSQALYAAETGINDLYYKLQNNPASLLDEKTTCNVTNWPTDGANGIVNPNSSNEAAYTCLLYDQTPSFIDFNNGSVTTQQSKIFPIQPRSNDQVRSLTFSWSGARGNTAFTLPTDCSLVNVLPTNTANPGVPILRVDLVRVPTGVPVDLNTIIENDTSTFFLYPKQACGATQSNYSTHVATADRGRVIEVNCTNSMDVNGYACQYKIDNMNTTNGGSNRYFARIKSIYNDADVRIQGESTAVGAGIEFVGAQVAADVTGKSNDVLRRIKVQLGNPSYPIPEFATQGLNGVCKQIEISPPNQAPVLCP